MSLTECPVGCVIQHQKGNPLLHPKIQDAHNIWVNKPSESTRLYQKSLSVVIGQLHREQLDGCLRAEVNMLPKIDLSKASFTEKTDELITAKLLSYLVCHGCGPPSCVEIPRLLIDLRGYFGDNCRGEGSLCQVNETPRS